MLGDKSYNEILSKLAGIASNLLSNRLKSLEEDGIIKSELYQTHPPRYKYTLTEKGKDLEDVFNSIILWGSRHLNKCYKKLVAKKSGHKVEIRYYLPETKELLCKEDVEAREIC